MKLYLGIITALLATQAIFAQEVNQVNRKNNFYFYWGYNRSAFSASDINFTGPGYDFTLYDVEAVDKPTPFSLENYFKPANISIPQYMYRIGWFVTDNVSLSIGMDHMKYVMIQDRDVAISGSISQPGNPFNGNYEESVNSIALADTFLTFEHTDGLNYLNFGVDYYHSFYQIPSGKFRVEGFGGAGIGMQIPKSNVQLFNENRHDAFHIAGWGAHANLGINLIGWKFLFFRSQLKSGFQHMPDILTRSGGGPDRASQFFWFTMWDFALGAQWSF